MIDSLMEAQTHLNEAGVDAEIEEVAADKGYHSADALAQAAELDVRTYIPEPERRDNRHWTDKPDEYQSSVYNNRRRMRREKGKQLQRKRSELVERTFAHMCETGDARRTWLRGLEKVRKRWLIQAVARNLGLILRHVFGRGTARGMQGVQGFALRVYFACLIISARLRVRVRQDRVLFGRAHHAVQTAGRWIWMCWSPRMTSFTTGC